MNDIYLSRCNDLLNFYKENNDIDNFNKMQIVKEILETKNSFLNLSFDTAINIFLDLGYSLDEAKQEYKKATEFKK